MKRLFSCLPSLPRPISRFLRVIAGAALAAAIAAGISGLGNLPYDSGVLVLLTSGLVAADKFLRDKGVY